MIAPISSSGETWTRCRSASLIRKDYFVPTSFLLIIQNSIILPHCVLGSCVPLSWYMTRWQLIVTRYLAQPIKCVCAHAFVHGSMYWASAILFRTGTLLGRGFGLQYAKKSIVGPVKIPMTSVAIMNHPTIVVSVYSNKAPPHKSEDS